MDGGSRDMAVTAVSELETGYQSGERRSIMESKVKYLPLGSVVLLKGGVQKVIVNARGMVAANFEPPKFFDYGGSLYPQGIIGDQIMYFNHEDIKTVVFTGYTDEDDKRMVDNINEWFEQSDFERGNTEEIKKSRSGLNGE